MAKRVTQEQREELLAMTEQGVSPPNISKEMDIAVPTIYRILSEEGVRPAKQYKRTSFRKLTEEEVDEFLKRYFDFEPVAQLLTDFSLTHTQMYSLLEDRDLEPRMRQKETIEAKSAALDHAVKLYAESNLTIMEIVEETGVQQPTLHNEVKRRNVPLRRPRSRPKKYGTDGLREVDKERLAEMGELHKYEEADAASVTPEGDQESSDSVIEQED